MSTSGWTLPSVMSVMTALYPEAHRTCTYADRLPQEVTTLAEVLRANGRATAGFISNPLVGSRYGFADGFDLYDDFTVALDAGLDLFAQHGEIRNEQQLAGTGELATQTAVKWLERRPRQPFFLFVFYIDPHYDYLPPAPFDTMFDPNYPGDMDGRGISHEPRHSQRPADRDLQHLLALYDGEIRYTDSCVATLLHALARSSVLENTLIIVFGDHGDEFYEHGKTAHGDTLYQEIVHVPLILWGPGRLPAGRRIDAVTSLVDIMPTVLDYLDLPRTGPLQGASLRPLVEGTAERTHDTVWAERAIGAPVQAVIGERHKLIRNVRDNTWELYHLAQDPGERTNVYGQTPATDVQLALAAQWERWTRDNRALSDSLAGGKRTPAVPLTEQQLLQLKALGYAQ
jgi:arylsulfatase A-like enzyme